MEAIALSRPGRKRKRGPREPNGRISRAWAAGLRERDVMSVGIEARQRRYGLSEDAARDPLAATVIGRLVLGGILSMDQHDAAVKWIKVREAYSRSLLSRSEFGDIGDRGDGAGDYDRFCRVARERWRAMNDALTDLCARLDTPAPKAALDVFVARDIDMPELLPALVQALDCLSEHFNSGRLTVCRFRF